MATQVRGARQVGKTWLLQEFGRTSYAKHKHSGCKRYCPGEDIESFNKAPSCTAK